MELKCKKCGLNLGEMTKGKLRKGAVLLCAHCWEQADTAIGVVEAVNRGTPDFMDRLFKNFDKKEYDDG